MPSSRHVCHENHVGGAAENWSGECYRDRAMVGDLEIDGTDMVVSRMEDSEAAEGYSILHYRLTGLLRRGTSRS